MAKTHRIGLVQVDDDAPARSPEREALAAAINVHTALTAAVADLAAGRKRAEETRFAAYRAVDAANKAVEVAKIDDAEAIATGRPAGATKAARLALTDAEDELEATKSARTILEEQQKDLNQRLALADSRVNAAVTAVVHADSATRGLIGRFHAAQVAYHEAYSAMAALSVTLPDIRNADAWAASPVATARFWNAETRLQDLPPSAAANHVTDWISALWTDADAMLEY